MWEDKRAGQINMWESSFLKVRYSKQQGEKKKKRWWCFITTEKGITHSGTQLRFAACASKGSGSSPPLLSPSKCIREAADGAYPLCSSSGGSVSPFLYPNTGWGLMTNLTNKSNMKASNKKTSGEMMSLNYSLGKNFSKDGTFCSQLSFSLCRKPGLLL